MTVYCAFCRAERRIPHRSHAGAWDLAISALASISLVWIIAGEPNLYIGGLFSFLIVGFEIYRGLTWRYFIICSDCGFDPILYRKDPEKAANQVRDFLDHVEAQPGSLRSARSRLPLKKIGIAQRAKQTLASQSAKADLYPNI